MIWKSCLDFESLCPRSISIIFWRDSSFQIARKGLRMLFDCVYSDLLGIPGVFGTEEWSTS